MEPNETYSLNITHVTTSKLLDSSEHVKVGEMAKITIIDDDGKCDCVITQKKVLYT